MLDSRPRYSYALADGFTFELIADHGDRPATTITFQRSGVTERATKVPDRRLPCMCITCAISRREY